MFSRTMIASSITMPTASVSPSRVRSVEHTSELQSPDHLVCRLLLEKKKEKKNLGAEPRVSAPPSGGRPRRGPVAHATVTSPTPRRTTSQACEALFSHTAFRSIAFYH